jgi:lambda family phage tail tape measure protein
MSALGSLVVKLALNYAEYTKGLDKGSQEALKFAQNAQRSFDTVAASAKNFFIGLAAGAATAIVGLYGVSATIEKMKVSLNGMDKINDLSERLSISTNTLQEFAYAGQLSGIEMDGMAASLKKLQVNMLESITGGKAQEAVFKAMGVAVKDSNGNMRDTKSVLMDVANVFAGLEDGPTKTALAIRLLGKQGADMVPFLNQGAEGIRQLTGEAHKLGVVLTSDQIKAAAEFNDNLDRMRALSGATAAQMTSNMIPAINDLLLRFIEARKEAKGFFEALQITGGMTIGKAVGNHYDKQLADIETQISLTKKLMDEQKNLPSIVKSFGASQSDLDALERQRRVILNYVGLRAREKSPGSVANFMEMEGQAKDSGAPKVDAKKIAASLLDSKNKETGDDPTKKNMEGELKLIQYRLEQERDVLQYSLQISSELRGQDVLDAKSYYAEKKAAIQDDLQFTVKAYDEQIAILRDYRAVAEKDVDKADATNKIAELQAKQTKAIQDASQKTVLTLLEEGRARSELKSQFVEYARAQAKSIELAEFELGLFGLSAIEIEKLREAKRSDLEIEEMRYQARKRGTDLTQEEIARAKALRDSRIESISKRDAIENDPWYNATESIRRYGEEAGKTGKQIGDSIANGMRSAEDAWVQFAMTGKLSFSDLARSVAADMVRMQARQGVAAGGDWLGALFKSFAGTAGRIGSGASAADLDLLGVGLPTATAAGGFDVPAGVNPITQLHEKEMVLPAEHADVIRGLASGNGGRGDVSINLNVINQTGTPSQAKAQRNSDGSFDVILTALENQLGDRAASGQGAIVAGLNSRFVLQERI